jgi:hypothetical protein
MHEEQTAGLISWTHLEYLSYTSEGGNTNTRGAMCEAKALRDPIED